MPETREICGDIEGGPCVWPDCKCQPEEKPIPFTRTRSIEVEYNDAHRWLDDKSVPRTQEMYDGTAVLTLVGRLEILDGRVTDDA